MKFLIVYLMFWIFSVLGWIMEEFVFLVCDKKIVNRGFLLGPYCPIYGFGGIVMLLLLPYKDEPLTCFLLALILCTIIEYIASFLMEKLFKVRWWDYSNNAFNINGRVCLQNAIAFGLLGMLATSYVIPWLFSILSNINNNTLIILSIIVLVITTIDIIVSFNVMNNIKKNIRKNIKKLENRDATDDIKEMIKKAIVSDSKLEKRIVKAYEYFSYQKEEFLEKIDNFKKTVEKRKIFLAYGTFCGILIAIILGLMTKTYKVWLTLFISLGFFVDIIIYNIRSRK